jgi:hypothetical protein
MIEYPSILQKYKEETRFNVYRSLMCIYFSLYSLEITINNFTQDLIEIGIEITAISTSTRVDYTGNITITDTGEYYIPNYSTAFVSSIKRNGVVLTPGSYVTLASGDTIDIIGILSSPRINDTVDVFILGPKNYQISVQTVSTYIPKYMDFVLLLTKPEFSANPLVKFGYTSVGLRTDPFVRFDYQSSPIVVQDIPPNELTGDVQPIMLSTDQSDLGATLIRTAADGTVTQGKIITNVVNGDTIQIVKKLYDYQETGIKLQVVYFDSQAQLSDVFDVGIWTVIQTTKTAQFLSPAKDTIIDASIALRDLALTYFDFDNH